MQPPLPSSTSSNEINLLNKSFAFMERQLRNHIQELNRYREHLEDRVNARTSELTRVNQQLQQEIIERKQAQEELLLLTAMVEQSTDGIIRTDTEFRINYINNATQALYGWSLDELQGKTPDRFNVDPHADEIQDNIYTTVSSGKTYFGEALNVRKDGSTFYCQLKVSPLKNEKGEIYGYMVSERDITDRKRAEEEITTRNHVQ